MRVVKSYVLTAVMGPVLLAWGAGVALAQPPNPELSPGESLAIIENDARVIARSPRRSADVGRRVREMGALAASLPAEIQALSLEAALKQNIGRLDGDLSFPDAKVTASDAEAVADDAAKLRAILR